MKPYGLALKFGSEITTKYELSAGKRIETRHLTMVSILRINLAPREDKQMFSTVCDACGHQFSNRDALCHDWQEPSKAFGCPSCHTFYEKEEGELTPETRIGVLSGGVCVPALMIFTHGVLTDQYNLVYLSAGIVVSLIFVGIYPSLPFGKKLVRSSYMPELSSTSK